MTSMVAFAAGKVASAVNAVSTFCTEINPATLSGAVDIVVVKNKENFSSSPFNVRFGKLKLLRPQEKIVEILINDRLTNLLMRIDEAGDAFFDCRMNEEKIILTEFEEINDGEEVVQKDSNPFNLVNNNNSNLNLFLRIQRGRFPPEMSPINGSIFSSLTNKGNCIRTFTSYRNNSMQRTVRSDPQHKNYCYDDLHSIISSPIYSEEPLHIQRRHSLPSLTILKCFDLFQPDELITSSKISFVHTSCPRDISVAHLNDDFSEASSIPTDPPSSPIPKTNIISYNFHTEKTSHGVDSSLGTPSNYPENFDHDLDYVLKLILEKRPTVEVSTAKYRKIKRARHAKDANKLFDKHKLDSETFLRKITSEISCDFVIRVDGKIYDWKTLSNSLLHRISFNASPNTPPSPINGDTPNKRRSLWSYKWWKSSFLRNVVSSGQLNVSKNELKTSNDKLLDDSITTNSDENKQHFMDARTSHEFISEQAHLLAAQSHPNNPDYRMDARIAQSGHFITTESHNLNQRRHSFLVNSLSSEFNNALPYREQMSYHFTENSFIHNLNRLSSNPDDALPRREQRSCSLADNNVTSDLDDTFINIDNINYFLPEPPIISSFDNTHCTSLSEPDLSFQEDVLTPAYPLNVESRSFNKPNRKTCPTSDQLKGLRLRYGPNKITFRVKTPGFRGRAICSARIFLWDYKDKIVISDIDGTITKSDALGYIFNMVGKDWTHLGVANLYTNIEKNGYRILYLTSRSLGQANSTREYLDNVRQGDYKLPIGPVIMSPDRLFTSIHREVILKKPHEFKMDVLRGLRGLFGENNPFYAGFGNRITDALSYRSVDIPISRIFTINRLGEVRLELLLGHKLSYFKINDFVDQIFPPVDYSRTDRPEYNDWAYWKDKLPHVDLGENNILKIRL